MALTKINGNQISTTTQATINALNFNASDSIFRLPNGTTAQRPTGVSYGTLRFNLSTDLAEVYVTNSDGLGTDGWVSVGAGGPHVGSKATSYIRTNATVLDETVTVGSQANGGDQFSNGYVVGPVEIGFGYTITVENGAVFYILGDHPDNYTYENVTVTGVLDVTTGRIDVDAMREKMASYRLNTADTMVNINYTAASIYYLTNINNNFDINILNLPVTSIGLGGVDSQQAYGFTVMYFNGSNRYRPTGNIYINGSLAATSTWFGGSVPATLTANREITVGLTLVRVTQYTDAVGGTSTTWKAYLQFNEFA